MIKIMMIILRNDFPTTTVPRIMMIEGTPSLMMMMTMTPPLWR